MIKDITNPAILRAMVQDGVKCERCIWRRQWKSFKFQTKDCPTCKGTGHTPLPNADLDALAAKWCEGWEYHPEGAEETVAKFMGCTWRRPLRDGYRENYFDWSKEPPAYTTSPEAAMRLQVKYNIGIRPLRLPLRDLGIAHTSDWLSCSTYKENTVESLCHAITTVALVEALTEAINE